MEDGTYPWSFVTQKYWKTIWRVVWCMVFNATFNNIPVIS